MPTMTQAATYSAIAIISGPLPRCTDDAKL